MSTLYNFIKIRYITVLYCICIITFSIRAASAEKILDHEVLLDAQGRLLPWTSYDHIIRWSLNFIKECPTRPTKFGQDPWYLITGKFQVDGNMFEKITKQNNQGHDAYWGLETAQKYYAYCGDDDVFRPVRLLLDRLLYYHTPADWVWPNVPRTQDDTPDGEYTDERSEPDKICLVALAYLDFYRWTGEKKYLQAAKKISNTISRHIVAGDRAHSPVPFRVNLRTGTVLDEYGTNMIALVKLFDQISPYCTAEEKTLYQEKRTRVWRWILKYPMVNNHWSGYYEDVVSNHLNCNQQTPMETARYILQHPEIDPDFRQHIPALLDWVENRFGKTRHFGAISIREQDSCFKEMSSHTARFASIAAMWYGVTGDSAYREKARAAFALATYSAYNKYSTGEKAINYVGIGYDQPWFCDSYWDYVSHYFDGMAELPDMLPENEDHLFYSSSIILAIQYSLDMITYQALNPDGRELLKLTFTPVVLADGKELDRSKWSFGDYRGTKDVLIIKRNGIKRIEIRRR
jgi:hypothetical protein